MSLGLRLLRLTVPVRRLHSYAIKSLAPNINTFARKSKLDFKYINYARCMCASAGSHNVRYTEKPSGSGDKHEFQAETKMLLDIVARSLYSEKEVFVRELISNASDALEKFRYTVHTAGEKEKDYEATDRPLEIRLATDKQDMRLIIEDTGIGMTREELISNLGTIARSGSKKFLEQLKLKGAAAENSSNIIGQFGVGFYSAFMVANKVEVFTRSSKLNSEGLCWTTDGFGSYEIRLAEGVAHGTKIIIHLKPEYREYADEDRIQAIIKKYSNFVGSPIYLNGQRVNDIKPLWMKDPKDISKAQHDEFFRYIANTFDKPRFILHYKSDAPISIRALLYFPEGKPPLFEMTRDGDVGVALYTRKILIQSKTSNLVPRWLRFVKGVVDSEDIPLNLSRELLQNSPLIKKLSEILTNRVLRFLFDKAKREPVEYESFYREYGLFLKEGVITSHDQNEKENIAKLLRFECSKLPEGQKVSLETYCMNSESQKDIYYLAAPNRVLAESSPYYENLKKRGVNVLFCYEPYDELVLMQLGMFKGRNLMSVEKEMRQNTGSDQYIDFDGSGLLKEQINELLPWIKKQLTGKVANVRVTSKLESHPCVVTVEEMGAARQFIRTQSHQMPEGNRYAFLQPQLEINPKHTIIKKLYSLRKSDAELADLLLKQLFINAMVGAGLAEDPRTVLTNMNALLSKALDKF